MKQAKNRNFARAVCVTSGEVTDMYLNVQYLCGFPKVFWMLQWKKNIELGRYGYG